MKNFRSLLWCTAALFLHASPALAQQAGSESSAQSAELDEKFPDADGETDAGDIVVTATKRATTLQNVPQSIAALSGDMLQARGVTDIGGLGRQTPGLVMNERADKTPNVVMRGVGAFGNVQGVGFYIDDVQNFTDQTMRLQDLERIELLKGPQGTLYGGSSIGGAIRYITKEPIFDLSANAQIEAGGYGYRNGYAAVNAPIQEDVVAARISGYYSSDDGFWTSPTIPDISKIEEYAIRGQLLVQASDKLKMLFTLRYRNLDGGGLIASAQNGVDRVNYVADLSEGPYVKSQTLGVVANINYDFGGVSLDSISSYTRQDKDYLGDVDYTTTAPQQVVIFTQNPRPTEILTQELRLSSNAGGKFNWIFGLYAANLKNIGTGTPVNLRLRVPAANITRTIPRFFDYGSEQTDLAAFASTDLQFGDLTVTTGLRLYRVEYNADLLNSSGAPVNLEFENNDTVLLPRLALSYKTAGGNNIYASVSRGYEPGRAALSSDTPATYNPEKTWAFELGSKGYIGSGRSLYYEIAGFYTLYTDRQFETRIPLAVGGFIETIANIGDSTAYGAEASLNWTPVPSLTLTGSLGYLRSKWDNGAVFNGIDISKRETPNSPKWTGNVGATFTQPLSDSLKIELHADASYSGSFRWKLAYDPISSINPDYWIASAFVALSDIDDRWKISARVSNLFDQKYFLDFTPQQFGSQTANGTCNKCHLGYVGERRRLIISASVKF